MLGKSLPNPWQKSRPFTATLELESGGKNLTFSRASCAAKAGDDGAADLSQSRRRAAQLGADQAGQAG